MVVLEVLKELMVFVGGIFERVKYATKLHPMTYFPREARLVTGR